MKIRILWPGKTKKPYYRAAIEDYAARIRKIIPLEILETREESFTDRNSARRIEKESKAIQDKLRSPVCVVLDKSGKQMTSEEFAAWLQKNSSDIDFVLGGPAGINSQRATLLLSFGKMTLPHELARVTLLEQIYRACTIFKKIPYHK